MTVTAEDKIKWLARLCAAKGLRLSVARKLFEQLAVADAMAAHGGNYEAAAAALGMDRRHLIRRATMKVRENE